MSLVAITTPIRTVSTIDSRIVSTSQIRYTYYRKDGTFTTVSKTGGNKLILDDWTINFGSTVGNKIYVRFDDETIDQEGTIIAKTGGPAFLIETDIDYSSAVTAKVGFCNDLTRFPNYRVKATIAEFPDYEGYFTDGASGVLTMNFGATIRQLLLSGSKRYSDITISKTEIWDGSSESPTAETLILVPLSLRSIKSENGANLWDWLLKLTPTMRILTKFPTKEALFWDGWKRHASVYIDPDISTRIATNIQWVFRNRNRAGGDTGSISNVAISKTPDRVESEQIPTGNDYHIGVTARLTAGDILTVNQDFINGVECLRPIMVEWINSFGAYEQHLFQLNQNFTITSRDGVIHNLGINDDLDNVIKSIGRMTDGYQQAITLQADQLTRGQLIALSEIKHSTKIRVFLSKDGSEYIEAVVFAGYGDDFNSKGTFFEFFLSLQLPDNFNLFDHLQYTL